MSDQERYIQMLERENRILWSQLRRVHMLLAEASAAVDLRYVEEDEEVVQHRIEEVLGYAE